MAKAVKNLGGGVKCILASKLPTVYQSKSAFHNTSQLHTTKTPQDTSDCQEKLMKCNEVNAQLTGNASLPSAETSMWESPKNMKKPPYLTWDYPPECCPKCEDIRFDILYYRPSDKFRKFQRTWWECCPRMVPKRVCSYCDAIPPEITRRCLPICPRTACVQDHEKKRFECLNSKAMDCMRVTMPCCRSARVPPHCDIVRKPKICDKPKCPYPSYSECRQKEPAFIPERPAECRCLNTVSRCETFRARAKLTHKGMKFCPCPKC